MINVCRLCTDPSVGYGLAADDSRLKCYMGDTGLLVSHAFADDDDSRVIQRELQFGRVSANRGMIVENVVAQQLRAAGRSLFYHTWEEPLCGKAPRRRVREKLTSS